MTVSTSWCSVFNAPTGCSPKMSGGEAICMPIGATAKAQGQGLQSALNVLLKMDKKKALTVDGIIGPATTAAALAYAGTTYGTNCQAIADAIAPITAKVMALAKERATIAVQTGAPPAPPPATAVLPAASSSGGLLGLPMVAVAGIALAGGAAWYFLYGPGKKKRSA